MNIKTIHEREIWLVDLEPTKGIELQKMRPCLVIRKFNKNHIVVIPLTSQKKTGDLYFSLPEISFLSKKSYLHLSQLRSIDSCRCKRRKPYGKITEKLFKEIQEKTAETLRFLPQVDECP